MKYLYINGDSFCGDGIKERGGKTFGELLCDKYNLDIEEDYLGGSSNHRIYRTTVNFIKECEHKLQDILFLIGWTKITRFEIYDAINKRYIQKGHSGFYDNPTEFWKEYIKCFLDTEQLYREHIQRIFLLQSLFENYNCKYLFYNIFSDTIIKSSGVASSYHLDYIEDNTINFEGWIKPRSSFDEYLDKFKKKEVRQEWDDIENIHDDHPNLLGHQKWFEVVTSVIESKNML